MSKIASKMKVNVDQGYIDGLIGEFIDKGDRAFFYDETNVGEVNKEDSREVSLAVATMYNGEDMKSLAQKMVVNKGRITYKSSDIYGGEELGDNYSFDISLNTGDIYNFLLSVLNVADLRQMPFNVSVPRPALLGEGLKKTIQVYSDEEHLEEVYNMLASLLNVTRRKCKGNIRTEFPIHKWLSLDVKVDEQYLSEKVADIVKAACSEFTPEELEQEDKKNIVRESILQGLKDLGLPYFMISESLSFADKSIELTMPIPVIENVHVTDAMSDEFEQATGTLHPSEVLDLMQLEDGMADAAEASIKEPKLPDVDEILANKDMRVTRELSDVTAEVAQIMAEAPEQVEEEPDFATQVIEDLNKDLADLNESKEEKLGLTSQISDLTSEIAKLFGSLNEESLPREHVPEVDFDGEDNVGGTDIGASDEDIEATVNHLLDNDVSGDDLAKASNDEEVYSADKPGTPVIPEEFKTSEVKADAEELTEAERETLADSAVIVEEKNQDLMVKYSLVSTDPRFFGLVLQLPNGENITVLDYLEDNKVLDKIPLDSTVETPDGEKVTGAEFIKRIIPDYVYRYSSLDEIIDTFTTKITPAEQAKVKGRGLFGILKK